MNDSRRNLIRILQNAYSGEMAAAFAYRGHWKSLKKSAKERERIKKIEAEEWLHRENVGAWLEKLGATPQKSKEMILWTIGRSLGAACHVSGWFFPMYFAGRLENGNVEEYESAARFAEDLQMAECAAEMLEMARVELEHEIFFRAVVANHRLLSITRRFFKWS